MARKPTTSSLRKLNLNLKRETLRLMKELEKKNALLEMRGYSSVSGAAMPSMVFSMGQEETTEAKIKRLEQQNRDYDVKVQTWKEAFRLLMNQNAN